MSKLIINILIAVLLSTIETSFFSSFHGLFALTPFVFLISVYLIQHHGIYRATIWLIIHGLLLDYTRLGSIPFLTIAYTLVAFVAFILAKRVFSNRSFYGVMACTITSYATFIAMQVIIVWIMSFGEATFSDIFLWGDIKSQFLLVLIFMPVLFSLAKYIRFFLEKSLLIPKAKRTY